jgi:DNA-binding MarR family transcriptional regulator
LAEKGFIERKTSGEDGREVFIFPTEKACKIKLTLNDASGRVTQRLKRYLGEEMFVDTVNKVRSVRTALR